MIAKRSWCIAGLVLAACGGGDSQEPLVACNDAVIVQVGSGTTPTFNWSPQCLASQLVVQDSTGTDVWAIDGVSIGSLSPVITYGMVPPSITQTTAPAPLATGQFYVVALFQATIDPQNPSLLGVQGFRP